MNVLRLSFASLRHNRMSNIFNILVLAFGVAIIVALSHISDQVQRRFNHDLAKFDLVVGAPGSPTQLILSSIFHLTTPTGNIAIEDVHKLRKNPLIASAIPIAPGERYQGFDIVGTTLGYPKHYAAKLAQGSYWKKDGQIVIGSDVERQTHLKIGQSFAIISGTATTDDDGQEILSYRVSGILAPTDSVLDRLMLTSLNSTWRKPELVQTHHRYHYHHAKKNTVHRPPKRITALLITYKSPQAAKTLPHLADHSNAMQAVSPADELTKLDKILGMGGSTVQIFGTVLIVIAMIGFFLALFNTVSDRQYEIALLRVLGATRRKVFTYVLAEGMAQGIAGTAAGLVLGHILTFSIQWWIEATQHITLEGRWINKYEVIGAIAAIAGSVCVSAIPAFLAYRVNVVETLSRGA